jgi:hypothetical protein
LPRKKDSSEEEIAKDKGKTDPGGVPLGRPDGKLAYQAVRTETHKFVGYENGDRELYDLEADPYELESIHESADPTLLEDLMAKLGALRSCSEEGCRQDEDAP